MERPILGRRPARTLGTIACLVVLLAMGTGCRSIVGEPMSSEQRRSTLCVERHANDERDLARKIAASLRASGVEAVPAAPGGCAEAGPYYVKYIDNWSWDMRMYLSKLTIELVGTRTGEIVAYGESRQDSLGALGMSHRDVVDRAVSALLSSGE